MGEVKKIGTSDTQRLWKKLADTVCICQKKVKHNPCPVSPDEKTLNIDAILYLVY